MFYPPDLPDEWRLCFYSNRLRSVLVPEQAWAAVGADTIAAWRDDTDPLFRFILEPPPTVYTRDAAAPFLDLIAPLQDRVAGFVLRPGTMGRSPLAALLDTFTMRAPVCVDLPTPTADIADLLHAHDVGRVWNAAQTTTPSGGGRLCVAEAQAGDPRRLRALLEIVRVWAAGEAIGALFFRHESEGALLAEQARTLAEFMGV